MYIHTGVANNLISTSALPLSEHPHQQRMLATERQEELAELAKQRELEPVRSEKQSGNGGVNGFSL